MGVTQATQAGAPRVILIITVWETLLGTPAMPSWWHPHSQWLSQHATVLMGMWGQGQPPALSVLPITTVLWGLL